MKLFNLSLRRENGKADGYISTILLTELKYLYFKRFGEDESEKRLYPIFTSNLTIIPVTISIALPECS